MDCASPLQVLISPDGARLYVLCRQSEEIRALDAAGYAVIKSIEATPVLAVRLWKAPDG